MFPIAFWQLGYFVFCKYIIIMKRFLRFILTIILCLGIMLNTLTVLADTEDASAGADVSDSGNDSLWPSAPAINGESAILIEASTGTILYEKKAHQKMYPASITKILTCILAIENCELDDIVTFSEEAVTLETDASNIECKAGEQMSVEDCLYGLMLASANEIANALAEHISGSVDSFAELMNEWAAEAGATDSHFANANGLHNDNHYITAYDMAMITKRAIQIPIFCAVTGTCEYIIDSTNKTSESREINNRHKMVWSSEYSSVAYDGVFGGKTGYTSQAGTTLVTYAERDGMTLICVVLNSNSYNVYYDTATLFDYGFDNFELVSASENETLFSSDDTGLASLTSIFSTASPSFYISEDDYVVLPNTASFKDLTLTVSFDEVESDAAALIQYSYADRSVGSASVLIGDAADSSDLSKSPAAVTASAEVSADSAVLNYKPYIKWAVIIIITLIIIIFLIIFIKKKLTLLKDVRTQKCTRYRH